VNLEENMIQILSSLVGGKVFWDQTPDVVPKGDFIILSRVGGRAGWYMENEIPDHKHARLQVTAFSDRSAQREYLADQIEYRMAHAGFPACEPQGSWRGFSEPSFKKYACLWQFGVWYKPDVP
jgi:hypothetical protein